MPLKSCHQTARQQVFISVVPLPWTPSDVRPSGLTAIAWPPCLKSVAAFDSTEKSEAAVLMQRCMTHATRRAPYQMLLCKYGQHQLMLLPTVIPTLMHRHAAIAAGSTEVRHCTQPCNSAGVICRHTYICSPKPSWYGVLTRYCVHDIPNNYVMLLDNAQVQVRPK